MRDLGQKRTIHVKGYGWGFTRSLYNTKQDKEQLVTYTQTKGVKCIGPDNGPCWKSSAIENVV